MNFHFPYSAYLFLGFGVMLFLYMWSSWQRRRDLLKLGDWRLIKELIPVNALATRKRKDVVALAALFLVILSAMGPQFGSRLKEVKQKGVDVFIAMDTSRSMLAEDVAPSRLERAKRSLGALTRNLGGNRVGIIAFAKYAVIQCPLTTDTDAARMFLEILDENTVPEQGTAIGDAIRLAVKSFSKDEKTGKAIVLLTDGEDHRSDPEGAAQLAKENGIVIFTIGIGTPKGEVIKKRDETGKVTEFLKHDGEMVLSRLDDGLLSKIASVTGGQYYRASSTDKEIDEIAEILNGFDKKELLSKVYERFEERYQWFVLMALLLLLLEFFTAERPGQKDRIITQLAAWRGRIHARKAVAALLAIVILWPAAAQADIRHSVRDGNKKIKKQDFKGARGDFESAQVDAPEEAFIPYNIANTYYLEGSLEDAKRYYEQAGRMAKDPVLKARVAYNLGHLLFSMGKNEEAIEQFKQSLRINPKDNDAKYNIEYIRSGKKPPPQKQNQDQKNDQQQGGEGQQKQGDPNEKSEAQAEKERKESSAKENAEQILQMIQDQENEKLKQSKPVKPQGSKNDKKNEATEDW